MLNQVVLVGRLTNEPRRVWEEEIDRDIVSINLAIPRAYKNAMGVYETDFVSIKLFDNIGTNTMEYCRKGDLIGIKGRIESFGDRIEIIAEKVTFLSSSNNNEN